MEFHNIAPVYDARSRVLILGSFPSVKSRETRFFYGHPQNRFWRVMAAVLSCPVPQTIAEKRAMLLSHGVALWDVIASCDIVASSDASITNVLPNDISQILRAAPIQAVYCNGGKAFSLYRKHLQPTVGRPAEKLPSTSPANASWTETRLIDAWRKALGEYLTAE